MNNESNGQVAQQADVLSLVVEWSSALESYIGAHPSQVLQAAEAVCVLVLFALLVAARRGRRLRDTVRRQAAEISRLSSKLESKVELEFEQAQIASKRQRAVEPGEVQTPEFQEVGEAIAPAVPSVISHGSAPAQEGMPVLESSISDAGKIARGLEKSRTGFLGRLASFLSGRPKVEVSALDDLEELLILSDVGARCAADLVQSVKAVAENQGAVAPAELTGLLREGIVKTLVGVPGEHRIYAPNVSPLVVLVVGVNGVGKTTTVAKLAAKYTEQGKRVLAIAADTFRAAAVEQLAEWSSRVGFTLVRGPEGAKPSAVVFDGMKMARDEGYDIVLIDTAGRLHTKSNLMQELEGVRNVIRKHVPDAPHETVLVLDGVSGQNALSQAREFNAAVPLTGLVVTKLDGTPRGGIIVAISQELKLPVFYIGVGEKVGDLVQFDRQAFVEALFEAREEPVSGGPDGVRAQAGNT
jgi:fused signal recognition particle receptor